MLTKCWLRYAAVASSSKDSWAITWHQWHAAYPTESSTGTLRRRASAKASGPHSHQSTGLSACWRRYGEVASRRRFIRPPCHPDPGDGAVRWLSELPAHHGHMTTASVTTTTRQMLNKVPEVTVYFWIIKILCTTVGESFADYINETLGFGLTNTTVLFSVGLVIALVAQFRLDRYVPGVYWLSVVLISVVGTLLTDNLTDGRGVPLWISSTVFAVLLAAVFSIWYARERTLSIHTIVTTPREAF